MWEIARIKMIMGYVKFKDADKAMQRNRYKAYCRYFKNRLGFAVRCFPKWPTIGRDTIWKWNGKPVKVEHKVPGGIWTVWY